MRILMISAELDSFARSGGLGDAVEGLGRALARHGHDVALVTPRYGNTKIPWPASRWSERVTVYLGLGAEPVSVGVLEVLVPTGGRGRLRVLLLDEDFHFGSRNGLYGDRFGGFGDNERRFAIMSQAALRAADVVWTGAGASHRGPDVLHAHDWHAALALAYARTTMGERWAHIPQVFTVHNLAYQGVVSPRTLGDLGLPPELYKPHFFEHFGTANFLKGAMGLADAATTVSESYAREVQTAEFGCGLEGFLRAIRSKWSGIVNGIDMERFDPETDKVLPERFTSADPGPARARNRHALREEVGLRTDTAGPLFGCVSRLTSQKGIDAITGAVPAIIEGGGQIVFLGTGDDDLERSISMLARRYPGRVASCLRFDGDLARRVYGASDFILVPSRFEPCGLTQLYALRYGAIPIVTAVGGLRDTVEPIWADHSRGTGIHVGDATASEVAWGIRQAFSLYHNSPAFESCRKRGMTRDSSWERAALRYLSLYERIGARS